MLDETDYNDTSATSRRIYSIDFTRGIVMIIMALDHVRDMMHVNSLMQSPTNLATTTPWLFFTRWITYLCAPAFVFLAGTSAYLSFRSKGDISKSKKFLLKRGLWLLLIEFTLLNFAIYFDPGFHNFLFEVLGAIGFGFIILSVILKLPPGALGITGLAIIFLHNLLPPNVFTESSSLKAVFAPLFRITIFPLSPGRNLMVAYPPVPWLGIILVGFASGRIFEAGQRKAFFSITGLAAILLFIAIRFMNIYGDPVLWSSQKSKVYSFLSFMNVTKYPPSLLFCLITLGVIFLLLAFGEQVKGRFARFITVYGKVPLFYFIVHFYLIHLSTIIVMFLQGFHWADLDFASGNFGRAKQGQSGLALWAVYLIWIAVVLLMYKPCLWLGKYKERHKQWWLKYI